MNLLLVSCSPVTIFWQLVVKIFILFGTCFFYEAGAIIGAIVFLSVFSSQTTFKGPGTVIHQLYQQKYAALDGYRTTSCLPLPVGFYSLDTLNKLLISKPIAVQEHKK